MSAPSSSFHTWLNDHHAELSLTVNELGWISDYFPEYCDIEASIAIGGNTFIGRGQSSHGREHAAEKAITEAIERAILAHIDVNAWNSDLTLTDLASEDVTTSGFAVHTDEHAAIWSASLELVERDLFFCHFLTGTPFHSCEMAGLNAPLWESAQRMLGPKGVDLKLGLLHRSSAFSCYICAAFGAHAASGKPFGTIIGMGCASDPLGAADKAVLECIPNVIAHIRGHQERVYTLAEFTALGRPGPLDHLAIGKSLENGQYLWSLFSGERGEPSTMGDDEETFFRDMEIKKVDLPLWCSESGLTAMRAYHPNLQKIFFGMTGRSKIHFSRLKAFCGKELSFEDLHGYPHPFP